MNGSCFPADLQYPLEWKNCLTLRVRMMFGLKLLKILNGKD